MKTYNEYTEPKQVAELLSFLAGGSALSFHTREECRKAAKLAERLHATPQPAPAPVKAVGSGCAYQQQVPQKDYVRIFGHNSVKDMQGLVSWLSGNSNARPRIEAFKILPSGAIDFVFSYQQWDNNVQTRLVHVLENTLPSLWWSVSCHSEGVVEM